MKQLFKVPVGDWSKDGHNQSTDYYVLANYPAYSMRKAYKDTCAKIGLQMHNGKDLTGFRDNWRILLTDYEQSSIPEEATEILLEHGFGFDRIDGERDEKDVMIVDEVYFSEEGVFDLFMWFISYSMPDDFEWEQAITDAEPIVGYWCDGLNEMIGYGVFY